jgi:hypothetical protein
MAKSLGAQADELLPLLQRRLGISETAGAQSAAIAAAPHALFGDSHFGTLDRSQAPWVSTDIAAAIAAHASNLGAHTQLTSLSMVTDIRSSNYAGGFTGAGWRIDYGLASTGSATAELDNLIVRGRMSVYELLVHQIRATNGSIFVSSTGKAKTVTGAGPYTIVTETDHGFATNDLIRAQRFSGSGVYQCNLTVTGVTNSTQFTATLSSGNAPAAGMEFVRLGNTTDTTRQGSIYMTADDTGAPFLAVQDGVNSFASWGTAGKVKVYVGKLNNLGFTGYGFYARGATTNQYFTVDDYGIGLSDADIRLFKSGVLSVELLLNTGLGLAQTSYGAWDGMRAIEWWPDLSSKAGNPSLQVRSGLSDNPVAVDYLQDYNEINASPTGGRLVSLRLLAAGAHATAPHDAIFQMVGGNNTNATASSATFWADSFTWKPSPFNFGLPSTLMALGASLAINVPMTLSTGTGQPLALVTSSSGPYSLALTRTDISFTTRLFNDGVGFYLEHNPSVPAKLRFRATTTPASAGAAGTAGDFCYDGSYFYICTATNTWRRVAHATW